MTLPLTKKQEKLWSFIKSCERSPSFREMAAAIGSGSTGEVHRTLSILENKGLVSRIGGNGPYRKARAIIASDEPRAVLPPLSQYPLTDLELEVARRRAEADA